MFYQTYFKSNVTYLVFVGNITEKEVKQFTQQYFPTWKNRAAFIKKYTIVPSPEQFEISLIDFLSVNQSRIAIGGVDFKKKRRITLSRFWLKAFWAEAAEKVIYFCFCVNKKLYLGRLF